MNKNYFNFILLIFLVTVLCVLGTSYAEDIGVGEPRTVRVIYFLPTDWQFEPDMPQKIKEKVRKIQAFYAEQMEAHGYGQRSFRFETDEQGELIVHRLNGQHPFNYYTSIGGAFYTELSNFSDSIKINCIISGTDNIPLPGYSLDTKGVGGPAGKSGGGALVTRDFTWQTLAHELGHAFGLIHDFRDKTYMMAYSDQTALSASSAKWLSVHPYFDPEIPLEAGEPPTVELLSPPRFQKGTVNLPVRFRVSDPKGVSQVHLSLQGDMIEYRDLGGEEDTVIEFDYQGVYVTPIQFTRVVDRSVHTLEIRSINTAGDKRYSHFFHSQVSPNYIDVLEGHTSFIVSTSFSPDSTTLASASKDGTIQLWDMKSRTSIRTLIGYTGEGRLASILFSPTDPLLASASNEHMIKLWDIKTGEIIRTLHGHTSGVASLAFSPDGRTLASGSWDRTIKLWDIDTGDNIGTLSGARRAILSLAFSPDGKLLVSGIYNGDILLWDVERQEMREQIFRHPPGVTSVSFSLDGKLIASGGDNWLIELWDVETGKNIRTFGGHEAAVTSVSFLLDDKLLVSGSHDATVKLWEVESGINIDTLSGATAQVNSVSFSPDQTIITGGTLDHEVVLWDITELKQVYLERISEANIPDPGLRKAVRKTLEGHFYISPNDPILNGNLQRVIFFNASSASISDLTGLEFATNLESLNLRRNNITDISTVSDLFKLDRLFLGENSVSDISAVANLRSLRFLELYNNSISDISAVANLSFLTFLDLHNNSISDISAVADLTNLDRLLLKSNLVSDLSPLIENTGSGNRYEVDVRDNPLSYASVYKHIPILQDRGISVKYTRRAHPAVLKVSGDNQEGDTGVPLNHPFVVEVQDEKGVPLPGVSVTFAVTAGSGTLSTTTVTTDAAGKAETTLNLGTTPGKNTVQVTAAEITRSVQTFTAIAVEVPVQLTTDVNGDGVVNIQDLVLVASNFGQTGQNRADINGDGVVNISDLILVAQHFSESTAAAAPLTIAISEIEGLYPAIVQTWIKQAQAENDGSPAFQQGIANLKWLLALLIPEEAALLPNYPNPFNPETWIPYQLSESAKVTLTIHSISGTLVRTLALGQMPAGIYQSRSRAAYWDGKNDGGESVASGIYFYTLTAGEFKSTRKMLIRK